MLKLISISLPAIAAAAANATTPSTPVELGIRVLRAEYGTLGAKRKFDIADRLQTLCGSQGETCSVFCSETSFGRYRVGYRPICRVIYRCPDESTKSVEAAREEPIIMSCRDEADEGSSETAPVAADQPQPPPYVPPKSGE